MPVSEEKSATPIARQSSATVDLPFLNSDIHSRRHGAITGLLEQGVPIEVVSTFNGHADPTMTAGTYSHVTAKVKQRQIATLSGALPGKPTECPVDVTDATPDPQVLIAAVEFAAKTGETLEAMLEKPAKAG